MAASHMLEAGAGVASAYRLYALSVCDIMSYTNSLTYLLTNPTL